MEAPGIVFTDIDGVWTDGGMYYDDRGNEFKRFNTTDSAGVRFLKEMGIPTVILTGEKTRIVEERAFKLNVPDLYQGVEDKLRVALQVCEEKGVELSRSAYIGDDLNDLPLLKAVGYSAAPPNAPSYIRERVDRVVDRNGGEGAFRAFVEQLLSEAGSFEALLKRIEDG